MGDISEKYLLLFLSISVRRPKIGFSGFGDLIDICPLVYSVLY